MLTLDRLLGMAAVAGGAALATAALKNGLPAIRRAQDKYAVKKLLNTDDYAKYAIKRISEECASGKMTLDGVMDLVGIMDEQRAQMGLQTGEPLADAMAEHQQHDDMPFPSGGVVIQSGEHQQFKDFSHDAAEVSGIPEKFGGPNIVFESAEAAKAGKRPPRPEHFKVVPSNEVEASLRRFFPLA